jgi:murein DD-endopeptidase MepM/ murein hydrolase activator NlpD
MERRFQKTAGFSRVISAANGTARQTWFSGWLLASVLIAILLLVVIAVAATRGRKPVSRVEPIRPALRSAPPPLVLPWKSLRYPTEQVLLGGMEAAGVFQPTGSGSPESAMFGSTRTAARGGRTQSSFHEGVDIAAVRRDRQGRPQDVVRAIAQGQVMYVNRVGGNSNYGKYVVIAHDDPVGEVYSLYAHLADVPTGIWPGKVVAAGDLIGTMGNTSSAGIPMDRAHLHLEIALMSNARFDSWYRAQKLTPDHGSYNGQNLLGINPLLLFKARQRNPDVAFANVLRGVPRAFDVVLRVPQPPDFFVRYNPLWKGEATAGRPLVMTCAENGLPLAGRAATDAEIRALGRQSCRVQNVDEAALGRNGAHLVTRLGGDWSLTEGGQRWLEILTYAPGAIPIGYNTTAPAPTQKKSASTSRPVKRSTRR